MMSREQHIALCEALGVSRSATYKDVVAAARTMRDERDDARAVARVLAHSYTHDSRPLQTHVNIALAYPVKP